MDIVQRMPQTLWVVGTAYVVGILIALPIGIYSAYKQYSLVRPGRHLHHDGRLFGPALLHRACWSS
jgi:ABC-type arginine/histidine transport system permease subunit